MKKITCYSLLILFFLYPSILLCNDIPFKSEAEFSKWVSFYYLNPEPAKINDAIKFFCNSSMFKKSNSRIYMASFIAVLFGNDNKLTEKLFDDVSANGTDNEKIFTLLVLQLINTDKSNGMLNKVKDEWQTKADKEIIEETSGYSLNSVLNGPINDPNHLDILWAVFYATGESLPVERIISAVQLTNTGRGLEIIIGSAASWSMVNNAYQHKKVYEICKEELEISRGQTLKLLEEIVKEVEEWQKYGGGKTIQEISIEELGKYNEQARLWALALSGILSEINKNKFNTLSLKEITGESMRENRRSIKEWWDYENREDFIGTLNWLYNEGDSRRFNTLKMIINTSGDKTIAEICDQYKFNRELKSKMLFVEKYSKFIGSKSLLAFDLGRYVGQCQCGYQAGYISEDEAWMKMMAVAKRAKSIFTSWEEFGTNYIIGRRFWADTDEEEKVFKEAVEAYNNLLDKDGSWAKIPWKTDF